MQSVASESASMTRGGGPAIDDAKLNDARICPRKAMQPEQDGGERRTNYRYDRNRHEPAVRLADGALEMIFRHSVIPGGLLR